MSITFDQYQLRPNIVLLHGHSKAVVALYTSSTKLHQIYWRALQASVRPKIDEADIRFVLRKDPRKASRATELLNAREQGKKLRAIMKVDDLGIEDVQTHVNPLGQDDEGGGGGGSGAGGSGAGGYGGEGMPQEDDDDVNAVL